jgi:hypothetical protein
LRSYAKDQFLRHIALAGCLAAVLGAKLLLIARYATEQTRCSVGSA